MRTFRWGCTPLLAVAMLAAEAPVSTVLLGIVSAPAYGQATVAQRTVEGVISGVGEAPLPGAVVYLKDVKTLSIRSFISTTDGGYRFGQMTNGTDYELWADYKGKKSAVKSLSSFDNRKQTIINLKIDAK